MAEFFVGRPIVAMVIAIIIVIVGVGRIGMRYIWKMGRFMFLLRKC